MSGISSRAISFGNPVNKYKFNGGNELQSNEFSDGSGLEIDDDTRRMYDPQIGKFGQIDPLADLSNQYSSYAFSSNNPINRNDPLGLKDSVINGEHMDYKEMQGLTLRAAAKGSQSYFLNHTDYIGVSAWADAQMQQFHKSPLDIRFWSWTNDLLTDRTRRLISNATDQSAINIRRSNDKEWRREGEFFKALLIIMASELGGELLAGVLESGEEAVLIDELSGETTNTLSKTLDISSHAGKQMLERGVTEKMIKIAIEKGSKYFDPKNKTFNYILKKGFASGKDLLIGTNTVSGTITTVIRGSNLASKRFILQ